MVENLPEFRLKNLLTQISQANNINFCKLHKNITIHKHRNTLELPEEYGFGQFKQLQAEIEDLILSSDFPPLKRIQLAQIRTVLDLSGNAQQKPPKFQWLRVLRPQLVELKLAKNKIRNFPSLNLSTHIPNLEVLDLSRNRIESLDEIVKLGQMGNLRELDLADNPVCCGNELHEILS